MNPPKPTRTRTRARAWPRLAGVLCAAALVAALGGSLAGAEPPSLQERIDAASGSASRLDSTIDQRAGQIASLQDRAREAGAREMELTAEIDTVTADSRQAGNDLVAAREELVAVKARLKRALAVLSRRVVDIYKQGGADYISVVLEADGFDDLETRAGYLQALNDADADLTGRVSDLRDEVDGRFERIAAIKAGLDQQAARLASARTELDSARAEAVRQTALLAELQSGDQADLGEVTGQLTALREQQAAEQAEQQAEEAQSAGPAYSGGPYSIPTYIVICESGGNYSALNPSSGAGGAYQILPSTWAAYGGEGLPNEASKPEQDRIAALIWADVGAGAWSCA